MTATDEVIDCLRENGPLPADELPVDGYPQRNGTEIQMFRLNASNGNSKFTSGSNAVPVFHLYEHSAREILEAYLDVNPQVMELNNLRSVHHKFSSLGRAYKEASREILQERDPDGWAEAFRRGNDEPDQFSEATIREHLPEGLTENQSDAMVAALRNPDASLHQIKTLAGVSYSTVHNALTSFSRGVLGTRSATNSEWMDKRSGESRPAQTYEELTERQKVAIDFLARHPDFDVVAASAREFDAAIRDFYDEVPPMSSNYPKEVAKKYGRLVETRRERLLAAGVTLEDGTEPEHPSEISTPREHFESAGLTGLPEENLDLDPDEPEPEPEPEPTVVEADTATAEADASSAGVEDHLDDPDFTDANVTAGTTYRAVVTGITVRGLSVKLTDRDRGYNINGYVPDEAVHAAGKTFADFNTGDEVRVVGTKIAQRQDGYVIHKFTLPDDEPEPADLDTEHEPGERAEKATVARAKQVVVDAPPAEENATADDVAPSEALQDLRETVEDLADRLDRVEDGLDRLDDRQHEHHDRLDTITRAGEALAALDEAGIDYEIRVNIND